MPKPPVLAVVHNINGDISSAIDSITHRLLRNPNGYTAEQILAEMGPKAAAFVQHFMSAHSYLGTQAPSLPTVTSVPASAPAVPAPVAATPVAATPVAQVVPPTPAPQPAVAPAVAPTK